MFNNISWSEYLTFITVSSLIWYAFVIYTYYSHDVLKTARAKQAVPDHAMNFTYVPLKEQVPVGSHEDYQAKTAEGDHPLIVQSFADEVQAYLEEAWKDEVSKEILLQSLSVITSKYRSLAQSEYRDSLDQFIINQAEINCAVFMSENEVDGIWS